MYGNYVILLFVFKWVCTKYTKFLQLPNQATMGRLINMSMTL